MKEIKIEKITLNFGAGKEQKILEKGVKLLKHITGIDPVKTTTQKRIPSWSLRPGLPIGCKITLRGDAAKEILAKLLGAKGNTLKHSQFDKSGNLSFGIHEYIDIPGIKYDPDIGLLGVECAITLMRPGFRVKHRKLRKSTIGPKHLITKQDAIEFMEKNFQVKVEK